MIHLQNKKWLIPILLYIFTSIVVGVRSYNREPIGDELLYGYVLDENPLGQNNYNNKVENIYDAINSQRTQYFYTNGRTLVHIIVQMFAGVWGYKAYSVFAGVLIFSVLLFFTAYSIPSQKQKSLLLCTLISISYLYLFQNNSGLWYSVTGGLNYLFPMLLVLLYLLTINAINNQKMPKWLYPLLLILGFITGWSQECYSLPLSAAIFICMIIKLKERKKISIRFWFLAISLWIGTCILFFAPGNFVRIGDSSLLCAPIKGFKFLCGTIIFWILLVSIFLLKIKNKTKFNNFLNTNLINILLLSFSILLGFVANTLPQSFNGVSFYSAILLFRLLDTSNFFRKSHYIISLLIIIPVSIHQIRIIEESTKLSKIYHTFVENFKSSTDGVVKIPTIKVSNDVRPFIVNWFSNKFLMDWRMLTLEKYYFNGSKRIFPLDSLDYGYFSIRKSDIIDLISKKGDPQRILQGEKYLWLPEELILDKDSVFLILDNLEPARESKGDRIINILKELIKKESSSRKNTAHNTHMIIEDSLTIKGKGALVGIDKGVGTKVISYTIKSKER